MKTDDPIFVDLALKQIAGKASEAEQARLRELLKRSELAAEFKQLQADVNLAKEVLPLIGEEPAAVPVLSDFELSQMRKLAEQREQRIAGENRKTSWSWRWVLGLAAATAVAVMLVILNQSPQRTTVQFAMLDSMGTMRGGTNDVTVKLVAAMQENFGQTNFTLYSESQELIQWLNQWPTGRAYKIVYDRDNAEVRILSRVSGNSQVVKKFPVAKEENLATVLKEASAMIQELEKAKP